MFIDVTRYGGLRVMRLAVGAIAYLDTCDGGTSIHLLGGETLRVNEDPQEIELRCMIDQEDAAAATEAPGEAPDLQPAVEAPSVAQAAAPKVKGKAR